MTNPLLGLYFHTFERTLPPSPRSFIKWQGQVMAERDGFYLVELLSWVDGQPAHQRLLPMSAMVEWRFYKTVEAMRDAAERFTGVADGPHVGQPRERP